MSYSLGTQGSPAELAEGLRESRDASTGFTDLTLEHINLGIDTVERAAERLAEKDNGTFGVSLYGHANQGQDDSVRDSFHLSINPITPPAGSGG